MNYANFLTQKIYILETYSFKVIIVEFAYCKNIVYKPQLINVCAANFTA